MASHQEENGWQLHPVAGDTGMAYMGIKDEQKIFLKKNTSPFLAALSIKGITPRLIWTRRMGNGDILTAQEWCNGRDLEKEEINSQRVVKVIKKFQTSDTLLRILKKVGGKRVAADHFLEQYVNDIEEELKSHPLIQTIFKELKQTKPLIASNEMTVTHGDMSRQNWLLSDKNKLYLVDWDGAVIADRACDVGSILAHYVAKEDWHHWLSYYEEDLSQSLNERVNWYAKMALLISANKYCREQKYHKMNESLKKLTLL